MEIKEVKEAIDEASKALKEGNTEAKNLAQKAIDEAKELLKKLDDKATSEEVKSLREEYENEVKELKKEIDELGVKMTNAGVKPNELKSFNEALTDILKENESNLKSLKGDRSFGGVKFDVNADLAKAAGTITIAGNYSGGVVGLSSWDPEFARIQRRKPFMRELVNVKTTDSLYIAWAEQANPDPGVAGTVAEGAAKPQTDFDIVERSAKVEKIAVWIKASREALADIKFLQSEINTELRELVELKLDEQILSGNGTSPNLKGILEYAPDFAAGSAFAGMVAGANKYDVIVAAVAQIAAANFTADTVVVNPADYYSMMLIKNSFNSYDRPVFIDDSGMRIAGLRVVMNNGVAAGSFLVGDFKKDNLAIREDLNIQIGYVNDDFTKNLVTILAELRAVNYIKTNHINAFVQGEFATAIAALEATT